MGVPGLWNVLGNAGLDQSLLGRSLTDGFARNDHGHGLWIIGIDASIWMRQSQAIFYHAGHSRAGENPELRTLFFKLSHLLNTCILPVFVFDGPDRPQVKRGVNVRPQPHWLTEQFQELIDAFGFHSHQAPGEAEAELAQLNLVGAIDAVLTNDCDTLVFGAKEVIRMSDSGNIDDITTYSSDRIASVTGLASNEMILIALLVGGDYDQAGLPNCGIRLATQLARHTSLGPSLVWAFKTLRQEEFLEHLHVWQNKLRDTFLSGVDILGRRYTSVGMSVTDKFPSISVLDNYVNPVTSWPDDDDTHPASWSARLPDLSRLTALCERLFSWGTQTGIQLMFEKHVWPGMYMHALLRICFGHGTDEDSTGSEARSLIHSIWHVVKTSCLRRSRVTGLQLYHIKADTSPLIRHVAASIIGLRRDSHAQSCSTTITLRIPTCIVDRALPEMAQNFRAACTRSRRKAQQHLSHPKTDQQSGHAGSSPGPRNSRLTPSAKPLHLLRERQVQASTSMRIHEVIDLTNE